MCGFAGFLDPERREPASDYGKIAAAMAATLVHRGPVSSGIWLDPEAGIAFGHQRLAIIDLSPEGHQPMVSACGRYVLSYNGEIYNHGWIRGELEAEHGPGACAWRGTSDTEVMLEAIRRWGVDRALEAFNGMFAFALWDRHERTLTLARDRLGEKPLYFGWNGSRFLFASELKAMRAHPAWRGEIDRGALDLFLRLSYVPAPGSIYRGIFKLLPGHKATVQADRTAPGAIPEQHPFWSAKARARAASCQPFDGSPQEAAQRLEALLRDAVGMRMEADVPLGAFLSGGIDSSTVVAMMQIQSSRPVRTFTIGFREPRYDEAPFAKKVAAHLGTHHTELYVSEADAMAAVPRLPTVYDEPFADVSQIPTLLLAELTRRYVTVSLSGDGGDELFCGYDRYTAAARQWRITRRLPSGLRGLLRKCARMMPAAQINSMFGSFGHMLSRHRHRSRPGDKLLRALDLRGAATREELFRQHVSRWRPVELLVPGATPYPTGFDDASRLPVLDDDLLQFMLLDAITYLPDDILVKMDRATMAHSLEARAPILDHRVVEFAWSLPSGFKQREGKGKWLLRQVLYKYVPADLVDRPKAGFEPPVASWLRGGLREWAEEMLSESRLHQQELINPAPVRRLWSEHVKEQRNWQFALWHVLMFQAWLDKQSCG